MECSSLVSPRAALLAVLIVGGLTLAFGASTSADPPSSAGSLDTSFDGDGKVTTDFGGFDEALDVAIYPEGRVLAAGGGAGDFALARYNRDGSLDPSFDGDGRVTTDFGGPDGAGDVAIYSDGRAVAVGGGSGDFLLARYHRDGSLDPSFDGDGKVTTDFIGFDNGRDLAIYPDGRALAAGETGAGDFALARYNRDGSLDPSFDGDGKVTTDFGGFDVANAVANYPDGRILAAGETTAGDFVLARYNRDGSLDPSFDGDGKVTTDFGGFDVANGVAVYPDGRVVAAGRSSGDFALARYNRDGSLDPSFDGDGRLTTDFGGLDGAVDVDTYPTGTIVAAGFSSGDFALARYNRDGSLDPSFDGDGRVTTDFGSFDTAFGVATYPDARIVAAGGGGGDFRLARYLGR